MSDPYDPSRDMLEKMHADDAALSEKDAERFTDEQRASARATARAYTDKHPSPHAARDKTEEWDMDDRNQRIKDRKTGTTPLRGRPGQTDGKVIFVDHDEVEQEGDDFEFKCRDGKNLDEKAEQLSGNEMLSDIGGLKRAAPPVSVTRPLPHGHGPDLLPILCAPSEAERRERSERWFSDGIDRESVEAQNVMPGGCVQEGFPNPIDEGMPGSLDFPPMTDDEILFGPPPVPTSKPLSVKDTNPKDAVGTKKWRQYCTVPTTIIWELGVAMLEGARKYGRHNYRIAGVRASVYVDAAKGHIDQWWEGEDIDDESKLNHITKAIASLAVLRDAMIQNRWVDDRPPKTDLPKLRAELQEAVDGIFERIPEAKDAYLEGDQYNDV